MVQRTKLIDDAQNKLLELLELLTTGMLFVSRFMGLACRMWFLIGTESETKEFMVICVDTVKLCPPDDVRTPVFIFERLCSIIYPVRKNLLF